ncbi:hypothetical protein N8882_01120 [Methylophilaceae bacterium]|nr:hypothetical protein [Methylophilaceae bacterium]
MKKLLLALATTLLFPNMSYAAACPTGTDAAPTAGCTIGTTEFDYTLTGDIAPASGVAGIKFTSGATTNTTTLTGNITTTGNFADGLYLESSNLNTTTLTGDISTTGASAYGLFLDTSYSNITTLTGDISTTGAGADGLFFASSNNTTTTLTGDISTMGDFADGLFLNNSNNNTTTLTGDISTTGNSAYGLFLNNSDSNIMYLNGKVTASHGTAYSANFNGTSDNNILAFGRGSTFITDYYNDGTGNTLDFTNLGRAASYRYDWTVDGVFGIGLGTDFLLTDANKPLVEGSAKSRGVADMDDAGNRLYQRLSQINSSLTNQQRQTRQGQARGDYWIDSYYTDSERDTVLQEVNQHTRGITVGFNASGDRDLAMDVIINYENSDAGYGLSEQTVDSNSLMVGLSFPELMTAMDGSLAVKFLAGMSDNDRDMTVVTTTPDVSAQERITDSYDSTYVTAGASWMQSLYATQRFSSQLLLGMDINHEQIEGSSASAYYRLDDRDITQLVGQAQYGITIQGMNKQLQINGSIGLAHANIIDGEKQRYTIDGTTVSYTADKSNTYTTASLGATYQLNPQAYAYAHVKQFDSTDDIDGTTGNVGLVVSF